ncbi:MAG: hypothetical protein ACRDYV_03255 [Acidimicrobiia bacterium]
MTVVVGVDPGGRQTGVVARHGDELLAADLVTRDGPDVFPDAAYLEEVTDAIGGLLVYASDRAGEAAIVAVEGVVHPSGHVRMINAAGLLGTATVLGAVLAHYPNALVVPPAKHGGGPRQAYPARLWPPNEKRGMGRHRHVRSAWDIAGAGAFLFRATGGQAAPPIAQIEGIQR